MRARQAQATMSKIEPACPLLSRDATGWFQANGEPAMTTVISKRYSALAIGLRNFDAADFARDRQYPADRKTRCQV
jgi:hypothetical protein